MAQGAIAGGVARGIFAAKVEVVRCPRCGAVWAKRRHPGCHGHKHLIPRR